MNIAYATLGQISTANPAFGTGSEPAGVNVSWIILDSSNSVVTGPVSGGVYANFVYGASWDDIRASIVADIRSSVSDPDLSVVFLPGK